MKRLISTLMPLGLLLLLPHLFAGRQTLAVTEGGSSAVEHPIPPIDTMAPTETETATFALG